MNLVLEEAAKHGFEFKLVKGQFNQPQVTLWGFICDGKGRQPQPKQVKQLREWPEPTDADGVKSFLAFVNYLRSWLPPEWLIHEATLKPYRKKDADFDKLWCPKHREAFQAIRLLLSEYVVLHHPDFQAASQPELSGRPFDCLLYTSPSPRDRQKARMTSSA